VAVRRGRISVYVAKYPLEQKKVKKNIYRARDTSRAPHSFVVSSVGVGVGRPRRRFEGRRW
jgi:hypothetical protein